MGRVSADFSLQAAPALAVLSRAPSVCHNNSSGWPVPLAPRTTLWDPLVAGRASSFGEATVMGASPWPGSRAGLGGAGAARRGGVAAAEVLGSWQIERARGLNRGARPTCMAFERETRIQFHPVSSSCRAGRTWPDCISLFDCGTPYRRLQGASAVLGRLLREWRVSTWVENPRKIEETLGRWALIYRLLQSHI